MINHTGHTHAADLDGRNACRALRKAAAINAARAALCAEFHNDEAAQPVSPTTYAVKIKTTPDPEWARDPYGWVTVVVNVTGNDHWRLTCTVSWYDAVGRYIQAIVSRPTETSRTIRYVEPAGVSGS